MIEQAAGKVRVLLHCLLAIAVFFLFTSSWWMLSLPLPSEEYTYRVLPFQLHKSLGITLLILLGLLYFISLKHRKSRDKALSGWHHRLAIVDHWLIYLTLVLCCISGYLSSAYSGWTTTLWWLIDFPQWAQEDDNLNIVFSDIHMWSCWALLVFLLIHITAALHHAFRDDGVIERMFKL